MVSINTNLSSLIVQQNLTKSTNGLNQAIERLTTGYKINHASDNAAGYSIAQNMSSQLSSYDVAAENISMGIDLLNVAADTIAGMQQRGERLMSLWTQAQNGTYGAQSITAINSEANAIISEITRMYINAEYNDISLFTNNITLPDWAETVAENAGLLESAGLKESAGLTSDISASHNGFIAEAVTKSQSYVDALTHVSAVSDFDSADEFQISTVDDLVNLANLANDGVDTSGKIFYMGADLDISAYCASNSATGGWNPIGDDNVGGVFSGTFDGKDTK